MKKPCRISWSCLERRQIIELGDFYVCSYQFLEKCNIWRTLFFQTYFRFDMADKDITDFLKQHNAFYRVIVHHYSSPAIVAGYQVKKQTTRRY